MNMPLRYLSVCSGIEAASVAWEPLGWRPAVEALIATAEQAGWSRAEALRAIRREDLLAPGGGDLK